MKHQLSILVGCLALLLLTGCAPIRPPAPPIDYFELAVRYNANVAKVDQLWARTDLELDWIKQDGQSDHATGEGNLLMMPPTRLALTIGKLGNTYFWAGCDAERYWLFDLRDEGALYTGRIDRFDARRLRDIWPTPVQPTQVARLLGLIYLPTGDDSQGCLVEIDEADWVVYVPSRRLKLRVDPATFTARGVTFTDSLGRPAVESQLDEPRKVEAQGVPEAAQAALPTRIDITFPGQEGRRLRMELDGMFDGREGEDDRIQPRQFHLPTLLKVHKPARMVDLDAE